MKTKICRKCGQEKPLEDFMKNNKLRSGRGSYCKACHNLQCKEITERKKASKEVKFAPNVDSNTLAELSENHLESVPARLLISELRRRGYRGELELVTIQKVVI